MNEDMYECMSERRNVYAGCLPIRGLLLQQVSAPRWPPCSRGRASSAGPPQSPCQLISPSPRTVMTLVSPAAAKLLSNAAHPFLLVRILISNRLTWPGRGFRRSHAALSQHTFVCVMATCCIIHALVSRMKSYLSHAQAMCRLLQLSTSQMASIIFLQLGPAP